MCGWNASSENQLLVETIFTVLFFISKLTTNGHSNGNYIKWLQKTIVIEMKKVYTVQNNLLKSALNAI